MPRVNLGSPPKSAARANELKEKQAALVKTYGELIDLKTTTHIIGYKDPKQARSWLRQEEIHAVPISGRKKKYWLRDVVKALHNAQYRT